MRTIAIIQARMGSDRVKGKVLKDLGGKSVLERVIERTKKAKCVDEVVIATTENSSDDPIIMKARELGVLVHRGSEYDVLDRYMGAALKFKADIVFRITADCPFIDPQMIEFVMENFSDGVYDYASNRINRTYPRGQDTEIITIEALEKNWTEAKEKYQRVHVTPYVYENPDKFKICSVYGAKDFSHQRWTVDTDDDIRFLRKVCEEFDVDTMGWEALAIALERRPDILGLNAHVVQRSMRDV